jgi:hypothetical protein
VALEVLGLDPCVLGELLGATSVAVCVAWSQPMLRPRIMVRVLAGLGASKQGHRGPDQPADHETSDERADVAISFRHRYASWGCRAGA